MKPQTVAEILRGTWLDPFLRKYREGFVSSSLYWWLYARLKPYNLTPQQVGTVYRTYVGMAESGLYQESLGSGMVPTYESIAVNPYLPVGNRVVNHYVYIVDVTGRVMGERSMHTRTVKILSHERLTNDEIMQKLGEELPWVVYTRGGQLASDVGAEVEVMEFEIIGEARTY